MKRALNKYIKLPILFDIYLPRFESFVLLVDGLTYSII